MAFLRALDRSCCHDAAGDVLFMAASRVAPIVANSGLPDGCHVLLLKTFSVLLDGEGLSKPPILWIDDGLVAVFFFLIGLELKREMVEGKLTIPSDVMLPGMAALVCMAAPARVYLSLDGTDPVTRGGRARPTATDIAFAAGVLALLGKQVSVFGPTWPIVRAGWAGCRMRRFRPAGSARSRPAASRSGCRGRPRPAPARRARSICRHSAGAP